jgi:hypothetical protein
MRSFVGFTRNERPCDVDALAVVGLLWIVSVLQVAGALLRHEVFGVTSTLASAVVLVVPFAVAAWALRHFRSAPKRL